MKKIIKNWRAILFVLAAISCLYLAVMGFWYTEVAKTKFWWTAWIVIALASIVGFVWLIKWFSKSQKKW